MDREAFERTTEPAGRKSKLAPYLIDIRALRDGGYSLQQVLSFLKANGVEISLRGLTAYLARHKDDEPTASAATRRIRTTTEATTGQAIAESTQSESHDPASINQVLGQPVNLEELARRARRSKEK
ncbi:hypothetical protein G3O06_23465 [Burkholderia sp. Ac-20345]|uniref:hypothetical protein n=1 Tax=Burkholderia sp. Ac-20345 TaxID=2703891 RepID=UPI00197C5116|nr:hypothetical protein [Burkholderia sp. Ac-20345]MBN3780476.1 hypothetical protein [Burkholderia sp. Ac-20345]